MADRPLATVESLALVALGGFAGANARYAVEAVGGLEPLPATLVANVAGSFALGLVLSEKLSVGAFSEPLRLAFGTGFLSSLTTYSTFAVLTVERALSPSGAALAAGFVLANYALGLGAVLCGRSVVGWVGDPA